MSTLDFTTSSRPEKPYADYPLFPHANGQWAKKIRGKLHYFGLWNDPNGALRRFHKEEPDLKAGRTPKREEQQADVLTVRQMVQFFLEARKLHVESGELEARTWREYKSYGERMIRVFGEIRTRPPIRTQRSLPAKHI